MLSYQHRYHAGSFVDVHKHLTLIAILNTLLQKPSPFCVLDTHAGEGLYPLKSYEAQKIKEYELGVLPILQYKEKGASIPSPLLKQYLQIIETQNNSKKLQSYPGSPLISAMQLREQDRLILVELHPKAFHSLKTTFSAQTAFKNIPIHLHQRDSYEALNALLPFKEKRGLIFIDPSFEVKKEYHHLFETVTKCCERFANGIYAIWYPLLREQYHIPFLKKFKKEGFNNLLVFEWEPYQKMADAPGLLGSGMLIINAPWQIDQTLKSTFDWLNAHVFADGKLRMEKEFN